MPRRVFFSFHFNNDYWRTQQVRNINALEGQALCTANDWEAVKRRGDAAVEKWIADQMHGTSCVVVLIGAETANRKWVLHEISRGWNDKKGVLGVRIHKLLDNNSRASSAGENPFYKINFTGPARTLGPVAPIKDPAGADSKVVYASISNNIEAWIEEAIRIRASN
jgi:MTH538 TIR-like domain (DUF1863)